MRPLRSALVVIFLAAATGGYAAGCAHGDEETLVTPFFTTGADGGSSQAQSSPPDTTNDAATVGPTPDDASAVEDTGAEDALAPNVLDGATDAASPVDAAHPVDASHPLDASHPADASEPVDASDAGGMSPALSLPGPGAQACSFIGQDEDCPIGDTCLIATPTGGGCVSCVACHGYGHSCTKDEDCGQPYQCYANVCSYVCRVGHTDCDSLGEQCVNVGNTKYGICAP